MWLSAGLQHQTPQKIGMLNFKIIIFLHPSAFWQERDGTSKGLVWRDFGDDIRYRGVGRAINMPSSPSGSLCPVWFWHIPRAATYIARASISPCHWPAGCNILISGEGGVIVHVIVVTNMRILVFFRFHIHFYHTPPSPASLHSCPLAGSSPTLTGGQKLTQSRVNTKCCTIGKLE